MFVQARSFILFFLFASISIATSVPEASANSVNKLKRQDSTVDIFNTLKSSTDTIMPQIGDYSFKPTLVQAGNVSETNVTPLINDLTTAFKTASSSLAPLVTSSRKVRRQDDTLAEIIAGIFTDVSDGLASLLGVSGTPGLSSLIANTATAISDVVTLAELLAPDLVAGLQLATAILNLVSKISGLIPA
ncbi:hypothetical protein BDP27DRAFT_1405305 [Rhodocollybia butyracea]|uniref:Uncharacterized protein n=1 Tax=Rhodocollybia butyracea TaxID=206335 RepID=A0A9P5PF33_9AGAR|nr:hypothetical protein BDP27DRAFT_1405305 [Rhodocollybia butyracea]